MTGRRSHDRDKREKLADALLRSRRLLLSEVLVLGAALGVVSIWRQQLHSVVIGLLVAVPAFSLMGDMINIWYCKRRLASQNNREMKADS